MGTGKKVLAGLAGGLIGGLVLSIIEMGGMRMGRIPTPTIVNIEHRLEDRLNIADRTTYGQKIVRSQVLHFLSTALYGAVYGLLGSIPRARKVGDMVPVTGMELANRTPRVPAVVSGPLFGLGVFGVIMGVLMPALGLSRAPWQMRRGTALREMVLHLLYGSVVAFVYRMFTRRDSFDPQI